LILTLPAVEISRFRLPSSFFGINELAAAQLSPELRLALDLLAAQAERHKIDLRIVARPEIFTNGETLAWLGRETTGAKDHLCISDGSAIRVIPGLPTHVFFYRLGSCDGAASLRNLTRRAPELLGQIGSQVNTAVAFAGGTGQSWRRPPTIILQPSPDHARPDAGLLPLYLNAHAIDENTARILASPPFAASSLVNAVSVTYFAISGTGWAHGAIAAAAADLILRAYLNPGAGVIILLPPAETTIAPAGALASRIASFLGMLRQTGVPFPRAVPGNIALATGPLQPAQRAALPTRQNMIIDASFDAWHHDRGFYERFERITLLLERAEFAHWRRVRALLRELLGRSPDIQHVQPTASVPR
jgi:hypothetical protein